MSRHCLKSRRMVSRSFLPLALPTIVGINLPQPMATTHDMTTTPLLHTNFHNEVSQTH
jgi:hypothetical protein